MAAKPDGTYFEIRVPINRLGSKKRWLRVGSATAFDGEFGPGIACTLEAAPLNWNGEFFLFPKNPPKDGES